MIKRLFDLLVLIVSAPITLPLFLAAMIGVRLNLGAPIFFTQERAGYKGEIFRLWKFRSMSDARDADGALLPDSVRITRFGHFLRSTSLDELPCLWNVAKGDMSFVGPRPFIADYLPLYTSEQSRRHDAIPGITGWAQMNGRNALSWEEKFTLDLWYVDHRSFLLDIKILGSTLAKVIAREGISADGDSTMPRFEGTKAGK